MSVDEPQDMPGMGLLQKLGGVTPNGIPQLGHPDDVILEPDEQPDEPTDTFVLRLDEREKPFYIEEDLYLRMRNGTKKVRIRSVDVHTIETSQELFRPKRPIVNGRNGQPLNDQELQDKYPKYREAMMTFGRAIGHLYILYGTIGLILTNKEGEEVWNTGLGDQEPHIYTKEFYARAFAALDGMGLSETAYIQWYRAINQISQAKEQESEADFLSDSGSNSAYL